MRRGEERQSSRFWVSDAFWGSFCRVYSSSLTHTDEKDMLQKGGEFVKKMNAIADGTPKDITDATDDSTFERKSKELVTLYR